MKRTMSSLSFLLAATLFTEAQPKPDQLEFFERNIRPVLAEKCYSCHSVNAKKLKGGLFLDHIDAILAGGDTGPSVVRGDAEESLLIEAIRYKNVDLTMPPREKLSDPVIEHFVQWIDQGAVWPDEPKPTPKSGQVEEFDIEKRKAEHWSWHPIEKQAVPAVADKKWPRNPIDAFILNKLESKKLKPAPPANKSTWLRRVTYDITGFPPTPEERKAFLEDNSPAAYDKVVDRLLASPAYGERWGRHWLDLMRYAETFGHEFDYPIHNAHHYRDYVIRAFNQDVSYDRFMTEHIAGDLVKSPRRHPTEKYNESIIGTGFWFLHEATHAPTDV
ncbi:MAG: DUF1549 domain-containing protein, partial [Verrucomicrobiota bacterium]